MSDHYNPPIRALIPGWLLVLLVLLSAAPSGAQEADEADAATPASTDASPDPEAEWQRVQQVELPAWAARRQAADARAAAAAAVLRGETPLGDGLPHLRGAPLQSRGWLAARRGELDRGVQARLVEGSRPPPPLPGEDDTATWVEARDAACAAEEAAAALERRILLALDAGLEAAPELREGALGPWRADLAELRTRAERDARDAEAPDARDAALLRVTQAARDARLLEELLGAARDRAIAGRALPSSAGDRALLEAGDEQARRRLTLRQALAPEEAVARVLAAARPEPTPEPTPPPPPPVEPDTVSAPVQALLDQVGQRAEAAVQRAAAAKTQGQFDANMRHDEIVGAEATLAELAASHGELLERSSLDPRRRHDAAAAWREAHDLLTALREAALTAGRELVELQDHEATAARRLDAIGPDLADARSAAEALPPGPARDNLTAFATQWGDAAAREASAAHEAASRAREHRDRLLGALRDTKELRRRLADEAPPSVRREDTRYLFEDVRLELALAGPNVVALTQLRRQQLEALPTTLSSFEKVSGVASGVLRLLLVLLGWGFLRRRIPQAVKPSLDRYADARDSVFPTDLVGLQRPLEVALRSVLDLAALSLLTNLLRGPLAEAALLLVAIRMIVLYRLAFSLFQLAVARRTRPRPALLRLGPEAHDVTTAAVRGLLLWVLLGQLAGYLARDVLGADALTELLGLFFTGVLGAMAVVGLHLAQPAMFRAAERSRDDSWLDRLGPAGGPWLTRALRGLALALALLSDALWQLLQGTVDERSTLGRFGNILTRRRLRQRSEASAPELPALTASDRWSIVKLPDPLADAKQTAFDEAAQAAFDAWGEDGTQGQIVVVGDRGRGLARQARALAKGLAGEELRLRKLVIDQRLADEASLELWFRDALELDDVLPLDQLAGRLSAEPRSVFVVEQLERAFLRRVGGFAALRSLLSLVTGSCDRHFWVLAVHEPAWQYLGRLGTVVHPDAFRAVLPLPRVGAGPLEQALVSRTGSAGFTLDYAHLVARAPGAEDLERARQGYFRLLAEAAEGNPGVALQIWLDSLSRPEEEGPLTVRLPEAMASAELPSLTDDELLVLAAVRVHGALTIDELVAVNNVERRSVSTTVQNLRARRLVEDDRLGLRLPLAWLPRVTRVLRRRHFLYGKD